MNTTKTEPAANFAEWVGAIRNDSRLSISQAAADELALAWDRVLASKRSPMEAWRQEWDAARVARTMAWAATEAELADQGDVSPTCRSTEALAVEVLACVAHAFVAHCQA